MEKGDIILKIDDETVNSKSEFEEALSYHSPGDQIAINYRRNDKTSMVSIVLTNREGTTNIIMKRAYFSKSLGAEFEAVPKVERDRLNIEQGIRVAKIRNGFIRKLGIEEGFIITSVNGKPIDEPEVLNGILEKIRGRVIIEGINSRGVKGYYTFFF